MGRGVHFNIICMVVWPLKSIFVTSFDVESLAGGGWGCYKFSVYSSASASGEVLLQMSGPFMKIGITELTKYMMGLPVFGLLAVHIFHSQLLNSETVLSNQSIRIRHNDGKRSIFFTTSHFYLSQLSVHTVWDS